MWCRSHGDDLDVAKLAPPVAASEHYAHHRCSLPKYGSSVCSPVDARGTAGCMQFQRPRRPTPASQAHLHTGTSCMLTRHALTRRESHVTTPTIVQDDTILETDPPTVQRTATSTASLPRRSGTSLCGDQCDHLDVHEDRQSVSFLDHNTSTCTKRNVRPGLRFCTYAGI